MRFEQNSEMFRNVRELLLFYFEKHTSQYFGVGYYKRTETWVAQRHSKIKNKTFHNGYYKDEETAAHASDTLARKLIENGEKDHKLNFPDDHTEVYAEVTGNDFVVTKSSPKFVILFV